MNVQRQCAIVCFCGAPFLAIRIVVVSARVVPLCNEVMGEKKLNYSSYQKGGPRLRDLAS